mmetsp:Transcript_2328/g.6479  ORF Transcript_2328/g.6479 Transcript_2328/m.6479 type:complete len:112 (-) Transcript_2328:859-1194(-)
MGGGVGAYRNMTYSRNFFPSLTMPLRFVVCMLVSIYAQISSIILNFDIPVFIFDPQTSSARVSLPSITLHRGRPFFYICMNLLPRSSSCLRHPLPLCPGIPPAIVFICISK